VLKTITNQLQIQHNKEQEKPFLQACISKRWVPHFHYQREDDVANSLNSFNQRALNNILIQEWVSSSSRF
jgi:hypothetical protein